MKKVVITCSADTLSSIPTRLPTTLKQARKTWYRIARDIFRALEVSCRGEISGRQL